MTRYLRVEWRHSSPDEPLLLYSELDENRMQLRKIDIYPDGRWGYADGQSEVGGSVLGDAPTPSLEQLNADSEYQAEEIEPTEFEQLWAARGKARVMTPFPANEDGD